MRVLHLHSGNLYGGVEVFLATLAREARHMVGLRMESEFGLCFDGLLRDELQASGARVHRLGGVRLSRPDQVLRARRRLARWLRTSSFDAVVCHQPWVHAVFGATVRASDLPLVLWMHMATDGTHWVERLARRTAPDLVIGNSRFTRRQVARWFTGVRATHLYYPVSGPAPTWSPAEAQAIRRQLDTDPLDRVIVQVSRMESLKGHLTLLSALGTLRQLAGWTCWIVGGAQRPEEAVYRAALEARARTLGIAGRVRFVGYRPDVPALLAAADLCCQPNHAPEAFGLAIVEALQHGLPVVTSAMGGPLEVVDERCGVLVPPRDPRALGAALRRLVIDDELRAELGRRAPAVPRRLCHPTRQLHRIERVLGALPRGGGVKLHCHPRAPWPTERAAAQTRVAS